MRGIPKGLIFSLALTVLLLNSLPKSVTSHTSVSNDVWIANGPEGGIIQSLAISPHSPSIIYASTSIAGVFKSTTGGASWNASNSGITDFNVQALAIDPSAANTIYAGTNQRGLFKSTDGGLTWTQIDRFYLYPNERRLMRDDQVVSMKPKEFTVLLALVRNHGKLLSYQEIREAGWPNVHVHESNVTQTIYKLRVILGDDTEKQRFIETVPKRGYRFVGHVIEHRDDDQAQSTTPDIDDSSCGSQFTE